MFFSPVPTNWGPETGCRYSSASQWCGNIYFFTVWKNYSSFFNQLTFHPHLPLIGLTNTTSKNEDGCFLPCLIPRPLGTGRTAIRLVDEAVTFFESTLLEGEWRVFKWRPKYSKSEKDVLRRAFQVSTSKNILKITLNNDKIHHTGTEGLASEIVFMWRHDGHVDVQKKGPVGLHSSWPHSEKYSVCNHVTRRPCWWSIH